MAILLAGQLALNNLNTPGAGSLLFESLGWKPVLKGIGYTLSFLTGAWPMHLYLARSFQKQLLTKELISTLEEQIKTKTDEFAKLKQFVSDTYSRKLETAKFTEALFNDKFGIVSKLHKVAELRAHINSPEYAQLYGMYNDLVINRNWYKRQVDDYNDQFKFAVTPFYDANDPLIKRKIIRPLEMNEALYFGYKNLASSLGERMDKPANQLRDYTLSVNKYIYAMLDDNYVSSNKVNLSFEEKVELLKYMLNKLGVSDDDINKIFMHTDRRKLLSAITEAMVKYSGNAKRLTRDDVTQLLIRPKLDRMSELQEEIANVNKQLDNLRSRKFFGKGIIGLLIGTAVTMTAQLGALGALVAINRRIANLSQQQLYPGAIVSGVYF